jgi:metal-responsive CopG/Arc/MetJ family transcriptional regulator
VAPVKQAGDERGGRTLAAYLPADLAEQVDARAEREDRSRSQIIRRVLRDAFKSSVDHERQR